jgi:hypothetical protein
MKLINKFIKVIKTYRKIFFVLIIFLLIYFIYLLRLPISLGSLTLYTKLHEDPNIERWVGEFYLSSANQSNKNAHSYFKLSLEKYLKMYDQIENDDYNKKKFVAYMIGNAYECGKGTKKDLYAAKQWYEKSIYKTGYSQADSALKRVNELIQKIEKNNKQQDKD